MVTPTAASASATTTTAPGRTLRSLIRMLSVYELPERASAPDVALHIEDDARAEAVELHRHFPHVVQALPHGALAAREDR